MDQSDIPLALTADTVPARTSSHYPPIFAQRVAGRSKRALASLFGIESFGVNLTTLAPGAQSSLKHRHSLQEEFVFVVKGELILVTETSEAKLRAGMCAGFGPASEAHHLVNRSDRPVTYLEIGDRRHGDSAEYPEDDLVAVHAHGEWEFTRRDGSRY